MSIESAVIIDQFGRPIHWHCPRDRSGAHIADSEPFWQIIWRNRENVAGIAHSHPGSGVPYPSEEDLTTFQGVEAALGKRLDWWIITRNAVSFWRWNANSKTYVRRNVWLNVDYHREIRMAPDSALGWARRLYEISYEQPKVVMEEPMKISKEWTDKERIRAATTLLYMMQKDIYAENYGVVGRPNVTSIVSLLHEPAEALEECREELEKMLLEEPRPC